MPREDVSTKNWKDDRRNSPRSQVPPSIHGSEFGPDTEYELNRQLENLLTINLPDLERAVNYFNGLAAQSRYQDFLIKNCNEIVLRFVEFLEKIFT